MIVVGGGGGGGVGGGVGVVSAGLNLGALIVRGVVEWYDDAPPRVVCSVLVFPLRGVRGRRGPRTVRDGHIEIRRERQGLRVHQGQRGRARRASLPRLRHRGDQSRRLPRHRHKRSGDVADMESPVEADRRRRRQDDAHAPCESHGLVS